MTRLACLFLLCVSFLLDVAPTAVGQTQSAPSAENVILGTGSYWRYFMTARKPVYRKDGELTVMKQYGCDSPLPPAEWAGEGFDDHAWRHMRGPFFPTEHGWAWVPAADNKGYCGYEGVTPTMGMLFARGHFVVADPKAAGDLTLSVTYRGGVVVYLNGKEVARGNVPDLEKKGVEAPAEDYPPEAYAGADGKAIGIGPDATKNLERLEKRIRRLSEVKIPATAIKAGRNVLAVEVHRAPYDGTILKTVGAHNVQLFDWVPMGLIGVELKASGSAGATSAPAAAGLQVWAQNPAIPPKWNDAPDPLEPPRPLRLAAARNGFFTGALVAATPEALSGMDVKVSELKGPGTIASTAVEVRYLTPEPAPINVKDATPGPLDVLDPVAPAALSKRIDYAYGQPYEPRKAAAAMPGVMQTVFLTVHVPPDAKPGTYKGTATVAGGGATAELPIELEVRDWTLPAPRDFGTHVGLYESPESVAMQYKLDFWSDKHWKLVEQVFERLGQVGADDVFIPVIRQTHLGNSQGMVRFVPKEGGGYTPDFTLVEKYLDIAVKGLGGKPPVVCFLLWDVNNGFVYGARPSDAGTGVRITTLDPKTGTVGEAEGPKYGTPEIREFWKPVAEGLRKIMKERGLEGSMMLGVIGDSTPTKEAYEDLAAVLPGVKWTYAAHKPSGSSHLGYEAYVYVRGVPADPTAETRLYGWKAERRWSTNPRESIDQYTDPGSYRLFLEGRLVSGYMGFSRMGADFWTVLGRRGPLGYGTLGRRYPDVDWAQLNMGVAAPAVLAAGKDGPLGTRRFEMIRAGAQESEARIFLEKALTDPAKLEKLGPGLAKRCQEMLDRRQQLLYLCSQSLWFLADMEERGVELYRLAGEAAAKLGG